MQAKLPTDAAAIEGDVPVAALITGLASAVSLIGCVGEAPSNATPGAPTALPDALRAGTAASRNDALMGSRRHILASAAPATAAGATELMDWAQQAYSGFFPTPETDRIDGPYVYRHYPSTGNYLGVADGQVYVLGPVSGGQLLHVGAVADFAPRVLGEPRPVSADDASAARALMQVQFSARPEEISALRQRGFEAWLADQMNQPRSTPATVWMAQNGYSDTSMKKGYTTLERPAIWMIWQQLWLVPDAVRARAALALSEYFVVSSQLASGNWVGQAMAAYWDLLMGQAFGSFRLLLEQLSLNVAMGRMLSILDSRAEDGTGRRPDENYARELMQLFTIGLYELNIDGTERLDAQGRRIETFDNDDVTQLARVFTGYNYQPGRPELPTDNPLNPTVPNLQHVTEPMLTYTFRHSYAEVNLLGQQIPADLDHRVQMGKALDILFNHANVGPFFARQMIQRLVTSNPTPAYVARVARVFNNNGKGQRGDLKAVFSAIWLDAEARGQSTHAAGRLGKLSEPMLRIVQWGRTFARPETLRRYVGFEDAYGEQIPLRAPSVFNFYRPGYVPPGTALASQGWVAPEFQAVHEASVSAYLNHLAPLLRNGFRRMVTHETFDTAGRWVGSPLQEVPADYDAELPLAGIPAALVQHLNRVMCAGRLSTATQQTIIDAVAAMPWPPDPTEEQRRDRVAAALLLTMASPEYLVQT